MLAELLDLQFALEEQGVKQWAPQDFARAGELAAEADTLYRNQQYTQASDQYQASLDLLQSLADGLPQQLQQSLEDTEAGIEAGDTELAGRSLQMVRAIAPDHEQLEILTQRVQALPDLLGLLARARKAEESDELDLAAQHLTQATRLDPMHRAAAQALDRVNNAIGEREFQARMSRGYAHLDSGELSDAQAAFESARALKADSAEAASALREVSAAMISANLAALQREGTSLENREQWQAAVETYERARKIDPNVTFAAQGLERSRERARLDKQFRDILDDPERLANRAVAAESSDFLRHAQRVTPRGEVLQSQISSLERLLRQAETPVPVVLRSDLETDVVLYKVARLGKFQQHEMSLRPGNYTAVGTRLGFRDVRMEFTVRYGEQPQPVTVVCTEKI
ncbi:MAG: hypothetical protein R3228_08285 [Halioglobus sp.]|nr:hypothetical protein [Halioglobus sp.]